jgi:hypothetical protein
MELVRRDHGVVYKDRVVHGLMHIIGKKRPWSPVFIEKHFMSKLN